MSDWKTSVTKRIVIDNGAYQIKYGNAETATPYLLYNFIGKDPKSKSILIGDQLTPKEFKKLQYEHPLLRGLLFDSELQSSLWRECFDKLNVSKEKDCLLTLGISPFAPKEILERYMEIVLEDFGFDALYIGTSCTNALEKAKEDIENLNSDAQLMVECGYSFTWIIPHLLGYPINYASKRIDVGGKMISNLLKQVISYRRFNISDEKLLADDIKEKCCRISLNLDQELIEFKQTTHSDLHKEFVLPNYNSTFQGYVREKPTEPNDADNNEQMVPCDHSMISIPEVLFNPSIIEIYQSGIPETIFQAISKCPPPIQALLYENIVLSGGTTCLPNFSERITKDLKKIAPIGQKIHVTNLPSQSQWYGLRARACSENIDKLCITKKHYEEYGPRCTYKFVQ